MKIPLGYKSLRRVLNLALEQAANGKGKERHATDRPFDHQPIMKITREVGTGFPLGQAAKKITESAGMLRRRELDSARAEILGAIVYLCAAHILLEETQNDKR